VIKSAAVFVLTLSCCAIFARAQSPTAIVNGQVRDTSGAAIPDATVMVINDATHVRYTTETNGEGIYSVPNLPPGTYHIQVSKTGFKTIVHPDIVLHVQDADAIGFTLPVGPTSDTVTVEGGVSLINTESAAVSTVVDRKYIENMPLNGRSLQDLILLTPGVVTNSPQNSSSVGLSGEFSVNGQRTESNYYTVDGVSANSGVSPGDSTGAANSGSIAASTALGTTQALVSLDALQEFRVQSSSYSAEYGRNPGGQFSFVTRSGTNEWHGTAFDYLRNDVFDANDWFSNLNGLSKAALRQNDFGGTLGGPIEIPHVYNGKDKTFFFFSYEGLRLIQPQPATVSYVPDASLRQSAPTVLQAVLNAFPMPNCTAATPTCTNPGNGMAGFIGTWSNPSGLDSTSVRLDHAVNDRLRLFFRFSDTPSNSEARQTGKNGQPTPSTNQILDYTSRTYTLGATSILSSRISNEFRLGYSSNRSTLSGQIGNFGGGKAVDLAALQGLTGNTAYSVVFWMSFDGINSILSQGPQMGEQKQWNLVDTMSMSLGRHQLKFGADYRRSTPVAMPLDPSITYFYSSAASVQANSVDLLNATSQAPAYPLYTNFSAFVQDTWKVAPRLNVSMGLRWEVNPAPGSTKGKSNIPFTVEGSSLSTLKLAPQGAPLWNTTWFNFAPRLGAVYLLQNTPGWETVVRGGGGVFFDTGQQLASNGYGGPGFSATNLLFGSASFPLPLAQAAPPIVNPPIPPFNGIGTVVYAYSPHLQLPYTLHWNASIEQALGKSQAITLSYVGSNGRRLLEGLGVDASAFNPNFAQINFTRNALTSDYDALQLEFQHRLGRGLTALASYMWSHSIDYASVNRLTAAVRGNADFDVRHSFSGAFSYDVPSYFQNTLASVIFGHWGLDSRFLARSGFPVAPTGPLFTDPGTGNSENAGLDLVPGVPVYLYGSQYPGGRAININAFAPPPGCLFLFYCGGVPTAFGNAPRNFLRGFGAWQMDMAVRREFPIRESLKLQFRAETFNIFNHPNFGTIDTGFFDPTFGQATATLAQSLGVLSPIYQNGGPRSMQFALKLMF
jgi:Carboxypeptidase regulatory-like domain/TonB dependent receptor-like, beta-barrel/TonB-dependent Receptor Plug Domain